jgi:hypothetical protein
MTIPEWALGLLVALAGVLIAMATLMAGRRKERDCQIQEQSKLNTKIDVLMARTETMERNITAALGSIEGRHAQMCEKVDIHSERIAKVEESAKQAHKRLDEHLNNKEGKTQ